MEELHLTYFKMNPQKKKFMCLLHITTINSSALRIDLFSNIRKPIKKQKKREREY